MYVKIKHEHRCECIAIAPSMGDGREWKVGKLIDKLDKYPEETHCLHLKTQYKDVTFLCNEADFRQLMILCRAVIEQPAESWMIAMLQIAKSIKSDKKV